MNEPWSIFETTDWRKWISEAGFVFLHSIILKVHFNESGKCHEMGKLSCLQIIDYLTSAWPGYIEYHLLSVGVYLEMVSCQSYRYQTKDESFSVICRYWIHKINQFGDFWSCRHQALENDNWTRTETLLVSFFWQQYASWQSDDDFAYKRDLLITIVLPLISPKDNELSGGQQSPKHDDNYLHDIDLVFTNYLSPFIYTFNR